MKKTSNAPKLLGALLIGAAIGASLGVLFAPRKGSKTRRKITGKSTELSDVVTQKFHDLLADVKKEAKSSRKKASDLIENETAKIEALQ